MTETNPPPRTALVVDDEPFMRDLVQATLRHLGIDTVCAAADGVEALAWVDATDPPFGVILCDLQMPNMDGIEFLRHLAERRCHSPVVLLSGRDERVLRAAVNVARDRYLNVLGSLGKPVTAQQLGRVISVLGSASGAPPALADDAPLSEAELRDGLAAGRLELHYQPKIAVRSGRILGVEALARWRGPDGGLIPPRAFVPVFEAGHLVHDFTEAVLREAVAQLRRWIDAGHPLQLAVNIAVPALDRLDLPEVVAALCADAGVDPARLVLEITETHFARDSTTALDVLTRLRLKGVSLSLDDFGTGYSSLEQLRWGPFNEVKVDHGFVHGAQLDPTARAILESSVALGRQLGMSVVVEGVEDAADWALVETLECDVIQGFFLARPMAAEALGPWIEQWTATSAAAVPDAEPE